MNLDPSRRSYQIRCSDAAARQLEALPPPARYSMHLRLQQLADDAGFAASHGLPLWKVQSLVAEADGFSIRYHVDDALRTLTVSHIAILAGAPAPIRLLIVEGYRGLREMLSIYFGEEGFQVTGAAGVDDALRVAAADRPEAVVLGIDADEFGPLERMRTHPALHETPIVTLSSAAGPRHAEEASARGADVCRSRPAFLDELVQVVRELVERRRAVQFGGYRW